MASATSLKPRNASAIVCVSCLIQSSSLNAPAFSII
jgi:hypothetical protein